MEATLACYNITLVYKKFCSITTWRYYVVLCYVVWIDRTQLSYLDLTKGGKCRMQNAERRTGGMTDHKEKDKKKDVVKQTNKKECRRRRERSKEKKLKCTYKV